MVHACQSSTHEAEAGESQVEDQPGLDRYNSGMLLSGVVTDLQGQLSHGSVLPDLPKMKQEDQRGCLQTTLY